MKISSPKMDHFPPPLISTGVTVTFVLSRQLSLCLKTHQHRLLRPRRNGGTIGVTGGGFCWWH
jgi:hypothetical protein